MKLAVSEADLVGRRVLVIEDESMVTILIQDTLVDMGCEVIGTASRFNEAVAKAETLSFDVAILDVNLNGQQTFPVAEVLAKRRVPFIFATGYGAAALPEEFRTVPTLPKPFQRRDLAQALAAALSRYQRD
jgi:CheY-like chemotaxis protein